MSLVEEDRVPLLDEQPGPIPANHLAEQRFTATDGDEDESSLADLAKALSLTIALLAMLVGVVFFAHQVDRCHRGRGHDDLDAGVASSVADMWSGHDMDAALFNKPTNSTHPTKTARLLPKKSKTLNVMW